MKNNDESSPGVNTSKEIENWIFSLIPVGVAFIFYVVLILQADIDNKNLFLAYGAAAGFVGLESYWIMQGLKRKRTNIVVMGAVGIAITLAVLNLYLSFIK